MAEICVWATTFGSGCVPNSTAEPRASEASCARDIAPLHTRDTFAKCGTVYVPSLRGLLMVAHDVTAAPAFGGRGRLEPNHAFHLMLQPMLGI